MLVVRNVLRGGRGDGVVTTFGICSGLFMHATLSALGVSIVLTHSAAAFQVVKTVGACYLVWLRRSIAGRRRKWRTRSRTPGTPAAREHRFAPPLLRRRPAQQRAESKNGGVLPRLSAPIHPPDGSGAAEVSAAGRHPLRRGRRLAGGGLRGGGWDAAGLPDIRGPALAGRSVWSPLSASGCGLRSNAGRRDNAKSIEVFAGRLDHAHIHRPAGTRRARRRLCPHLVRDGRGPVVEIPHRGRSEDR